MREVITFLQTKCFLLLLDLDQELQEATLVQEFFAAALDCIRQNALHHALQRKSYLPV